MNTPLTIIAITGAVIAISIAAKIVISQFLRIKKANHITFIRGDHQITISPQDKDKSKKLMHL